jgi:hypothetical protein
MRVTSRGLAVLAAAVAASTAVAGPAAVNAHSDGPEILLRARIVGAQEGDPALFGAITGSNPWSESRSRVVITTDGWVDVRIRDLINLQEGFNPLFILHIGVACNGEIVARTAPVPFDQDGDARVHERVTLPDRCLAPAVLVHPLDRTSSYIAASGTS